MSGKSAIDAGFISLYCFLYFAITKLPLQAPRSENNEPCSSLTNLFTGNGLLSKELQAGGEGVQNVLRARASGRSKDTVEAEE